MLVGCALIERPVEFMRAGRVLDVMRAVTQDWRLEPAGAQCGAPLISISGGWRGYTIAEAGKRDILERSAVSAACTVIMILLNRMIEARAELLCLHGAAARIGSQAIVFPSTHKAGKSTLVAALAFAGWPTVAEDILPIDCSGGTALAIASGVAPRLRRPVGRTLGKRFRRAVAQHPGPRDPWLRYVGLPPERLDEHGRAAPIGGFVFLDRQDAAPGPEPSLSPVTKGRAMEIILRQNFGTAAPAAEIVERVAAMTDEAPCFGLTYHTLEDAVRLLGNAFGRGHASTQSSNRAPTTISDPGTSAIIKRTPRSPHSLSPNARLHRRGEVVVREEDGVAFLVDQSNGTIFSLNPLGLGIWHLIAEPKTLAQLTATVCDAHPDIEPAQIEADIADLLSALVEARLARDRGGRHASPK